MATLRLLAPLFAFGHVHCFVPSQVRLITPVTAASSPLFRREALSDTSSSSVIVDTTTSSNVDSPDPTFQLGAWMPLGSASCLTGLTPIQIRICGIDIAVWHKPLPKDAKKNAVATEWSALVDACPHRLAPLSQGRVDPDSGCIECPYHGWAFDTDGTHKALPQLDEGRTIEASTASRSAATSLPVHASGDLLFVFLPTDITGESWPITLLPEHHYPYLQDKIDSGATYYSRDLPYSLDFLLENFMDPAHIPFAHHSLQGTRDDGSPLVMKVLANNFTHVECGYTDRVNKKTRLGVVSFQRPAFYHYRTNRTTDETDEYKPNLLIFTAPIEEGKCRVIFPDLQIKFAPKWLGHLGSNRFLNTDTWLHDAERSARINDNINKQRGSVAVGAARAGAKPTDGLNYILASMSDIGPSLFRKWWSKHGFADAPPNTFGPASASYLAARALSRAEQIDPWNHHAKYCVKCRRALKKMRALQILFSAGAAVGAILLRRRPPFAIALVLGSMYAYNFLHKLATAIEGNSNRAEIGDRSVAAIK